MKKIIVAINNKLIYEKLKKINNIEIIGRDIQYEDGILEILEKNNYADYILINDNLIKNNLEIIINKIKKINKNIKIIYFLEKEKNEKIKILKRNNIKYYFINNKIKNNNLIKILNFEFNNIENIKKDKKIENKNLIKKILNKNILKYFKKYFLNNDKKIIKKIYEIINKKIKNNINEKNNILKNKLIISIDGINNLEKNIFSIIFSQYLEKENKKILIIFYEDYFYKFLRIRLKEKNNIIKYSDKIDIYNYLNNKNYFLEDLINNYDLIIINFSNNMDEKEKIDKIKKCDFNFILLEANFIEILQSENIIKNYRKILNNCTYKMQIIKNKINKYSLNDQILKLYFPDINILGKIKYRKIYNRIINNNFIIKNKKEKILIKKEYKKIVNKLL